MEAQTQQTNHLSSFAKVATAEAIGSPVLTENNLLPHGTRCGRLQETGVVTTMNGEILQAVRSPSWIASPNGFGGPQRMGHVESSMAAPPGIDKQTGYKTSQHVLQLLREEEDMAEVVRKSNGGLQVGVESEMVCHDADGAIDKSVNSIELDRGQHEHAHYPVDGPVSYARMKAKYVSREMSDPSHPRVETSVPVTGQASTLELTQNPEVAAYIDVAQRRLLTWLDRGSDPEAWEVFDQIARDEGYENTEALFAANGTLAPWFMNALHQSVGLPIVQHNGRNLVSTEQAIGTADLFSSTLSAPVGWWTASTPIGFGVEPTVGGQPIRDVRLEARYLLSTTGDSEPILTPDQYTARSAHSIVAGLSHTLARAAYTSRKGGVERPVMHTGARIRVEGKPDDICDSKGGRVEAVFPGATPDLLSQATSVAHLQLIGVLPYEADVEGIPAVDYALRLGLTSAGDFSVRSANAAFNHNQPNEQFETAMADTGSLIEHTGQYKALSAARKVVETARDRAQLPSAESLDEYRAHPTGWFVDAAKNELKQVGGDPVAFMRSVWKFQNRQADDVNGCESPQEVLEYLCRVG